MKVALVNLASFDYFHDSVDFQKDLSFLENSGIDFIDYIANRTTPEQLLAGFHEALKNEEIDLIWFVCGGDKMIKFLDKIDWELVENSNKRYAGVSDFTHFSVKANSLGKICYYGLVLKDLTKYYPTSHSREYIINFLKSGLLEDYQEQLIFGDKIIDRNIQIAPIIGGHLMSFTFMAQREKLDFSGSYIFLEYHHAEGESLDEVEYYLDQLKVTIGSNKPRGLILGHSLWGEMSAEELNQLMANWLKELDVPIFYIDHFSKIIELSQTSNSLQ